ncbi:MAG: PA14 domain-containing protein [Candidatus Nanohalobium sp.]
MKSKTAFSVLLLILSASLTAAAPSISLNGPSNGSEAESPVKFQFTPQCSSSCSSATLSFNTTGNLTFSRTIDKWKTGEKTGVKASNSNLTLYREGSTGNLNYRWYDTGSYYSSNGHPSNTGEMNSFFNSSKNGVNLGGEGLHNGSVSWYDGSDWGEKPDYLPAQGYSWKASGYLYAPESGVYTIGLDSDDASDVFINGSKVVSWYGGHAVSGSYDHSNKVYLDKGQYTIKVRMEEGGGDDGVSVAWKKPGESSFELIPGKRFSNSSMEYNSSGSYETEPFSLSNPAYWTGKSLEASIPANTSLDVNYASKRPGGWEYFESLSDVSQTRKLKVNFSLSTDEPLKSPEVSYLNLEYKMPANQEFNWITDSESEWQKGSTDLTSIDSGTVKLKRNRSGPNKELKYTWYSTEGLNERNGYADSAEEMDNFFNSSTEGVSFGGSGIHAERVHWHSGQWDEKPAYLPGDHYAWKASGYLYAPNTGTYTIGIDSDDASDVFIDGEKVASYYGPHGTSGSYGHQGTITLEEGYHRFKIRMQEDTGGDGVSIAWERPNKNNMKVIKSNRFSRRLYQQSGNYTSKTFSTKREVKWEKASVKASTGTDTDYSIEYGYNTSGSWTYVNSISSVPETRFLKYRLELSTADGEKSPSVDKVNLTYSNSKASFQEMKTVTDVQSGVVNNLSFDFSSYSLPTNFLWNIQVKQSDGSTNISKSREVNVRPHSFASPDIKWSEPEDGTSNRTPINFSFTPKCYSEYGCYEVSLYFNSTGEKGSWIFNQDNDWSRGSLSNTTFESGKVKLEGEVGEQGKLRYRWYDTEGLNQDNSYGDSKKDMDKFFNTKIEGVSLEGSGEYSREVDWKNNEWDPKPSYLPGDHYSWKASGYIYAPNTGTYKFGIDSDDASDLFINGEMVTSYYGGHGDSGDYSHSGTVELSEGYHTLKVRMQEDTGGDGVSIAWERPNKNNMKVIPSNRFFLKDTESSGTYTSPVLSTGKKVDITKASIDKDVPTGTGLDLKYLENTSGAWKVFPDLSSLPQSKYFRFRAEMSSGSEKTPALRKVNLSYVDHEIFKKRLSKKDVFNGTSGEFSLRFLDYSLPQTFKTVLSVKQSDGQVTKTDPRTIKVKFSGIKAEISWNDKASNEIGYKIYTNASGSWNKVGEVERNTESFQDRNPNIKDGDYVCYRVKAFNTAGASAPVEGCATFTR